MARYYALAIRPTLFGEIAVVRSWGRIGKAGGEMTEVFGNDNDAISRFLELVLQKRKGAINRQKLWKPLQERQCEDNAA